MAAEESLSNDQFEMVHPKEIGYLEMRDYPGKLRDLKFDPKGEHMARVKSIMETARTEGIHEPLDIRGYGARPYLHDGHHRYLAAKKLGIMVPVTRERQGG